jgi:hypothetical protein
MLPNIIDRFSSWFLSAFQKTVIFLERAFLMEFLHRPNHYLTHLTYNSVFKCNDAAHALRMQKTPTAAVRRILFNAATHFWRVNHQVRQKSQRCVGTRIFERKKTKGGTEREDKPQRKTMQNAKNNGNHQRSRIT